MYVLQIKKGHGDHYSIPIYSPRCWEPHTTLACTGNLVKTPRKVLHTFQLIRVKSKTLVPFSTHRSMARQNKSYPIPIF